MHRFMDARTEVPQISDSPTGSFRRCRLETSSFPLLSADAIARRRGTAAVWNGKNWPREVDLRPPVVKHSANDRVAAVIIPEQVLGEVLRHHLGEVRLHVREAVGL